jgi:ubiquinone/menaquinone biosynthesis C-methylase UbiE
MKGWNTVADEAKNWWEKAARDFQEMAQLPIDVEYGQQVNEEKLQLIGPVAGKHLLEIGCGGAQCGIAFAKQGAIVSGVDIAAAQIQFARELVEKNGVSITFYQRDMTDLSPIDSESQDIVFSSMAFHYVDDLLACFKEVYRVLKPDGLFVWSVFHPIFAIVDGETLLPRRSYFDTGKVVTGLDVSDEAGFAFAENFRTVSDYFNTLVEAGFRVERMVEPDIRPVDAGDPRNHLWNFTPQILELFPATLVFKSRKVLDLLSKSTSN